MNLQNIEQVNMMLKVFEKDHGYSFIILVSFFDQTSEINNGEVFNSELEAQDFGKKIIKRLQKEFNLIEHSVH